MFHGSIVAIVTPMSANGDIDFAAYEKLIDWHLQNKTDGIVVLGTTGESATVEADERKRLVEATVAQVNERVPVIVGTGANSTKITIDLTKQAMECGADAALLVTPYYNKPTQEGLYQHFGAVAEAAPIPQILYNVPSRTSCDLLPETVARLSEHANIVALKEATGSLERFQELLDLNIEMDLLSGDDFTAMEFILRGGKGTISVVANVAPKAMHEMCKAALKKQRDVAEKINQQLGPVATALFTESNPIPTKWALHEMGMIETGIRLPLTPLSEQYRDQVRDALDSAGLRAN